MNIDSSKQQNGWLKSLLRAAVCLALITVVVSSYIRLVESGVGCDDWPDCYGQYPNHESSHGVNVLTSEGKDSPYRVARIVHRLVTSLLGVVILLVFVSAWRARNITWLIPTLLMLLTIVLAVIGQIHPPRPLPVLTLANFTGGMLLVAFVYYLYVRLRSEPSCAISTGSDADLRRIATFLRIALAALVLQILWGGWTSANFAGASCNNMLECGFHVTDSQVSLMHFGMLELDSAGRVVVSEAMSIMQQIHHGLAVFLVIYLVILLVWLMGVMPQLIRSCLLVLALLAVQMLLGLGALALQLPLVIVLAHNLVSALLMMTLISLNIRITARSE